MNHFYIKVKGIFSSIRRWGTRKVRRTLMRAKAQLRTGKKSKLGRKGTVTKRSVTVK